MSDPQFTPGPWSAEPMVPLADNAFYITASPNGNNSTKEVATVGPCLAKTTATNARLIAAAPDHALICWAMCVQDATWEEWVPFDGKGEFCFAGLRYATKLDEFGCPALTPALREAITQSQQVPA